LGEETLKIFESDFYISEMVKVWEEGRKWAEWVYQLAKRLGVGNRVLDVPCGIGRVANFLVNVGFSVVGIDISERMIQLARKNVGGATFIKGDMRRLPEVLKGDRFDVVINIFNSLGYYGEEDDLEIMKSIRQVTGGVAVINLDNRDYVIFNWPEVYYSYVPPYMVIDTSKFEPTTSRLQVHRKYIDQRGREVGQLKYTQRYYSLHEVFSMVRRAGFRVVGVYSGYSWKEFEIGDPQMTLLLVPS